MRVAGVPFQGVALPDRRMGYIGLLGCRFVIATEAAGEHGQREQQGECQRRRARPEHGHGAAGALRRGSSPGFGGAGSDLFQRRGVSHDLRSGDRGEGGAVGGKPLAPH